MSFVKLNKMFTILTVTVLASLMTGEAVHLEKSAYQGLVFELEDKIPQSCQTVLRELEVSQLLIILKELYFRFKFFNLQSIDQVVLYF
jgi:hypothetical protein